MGTAEILYITPGSGCNASRVLTVNANPSSITGIVILSTGSSSALTSATSGGSWSSSNPVVAEIGSGTGIVSGITEGIAIISYILPSGCFTICEVSVDSLCSVGYIITTFAGTGTSGYSGDGGPASSANLNRPHGIAIDASGNLLFTDFNQRIRRIDGSGVITTIAGTGTTGFSGDGGPATAANINAPFDLALDAAGNIYFSDGNNHRVRKISTSGTITTIAGNGTQGYSGDGSAATSAMLNNPAGVTLDASGNVFFADSYNQCIRRIDAATGIITTYAGTDTFGFAGDGGPATAARFYFPNFLFTDLATGDMYVSDNGNHVIRKITSSGIVSTIAGNGTAGDGGDGGSATAARLHFPAGVTKDASGNLYIVDHENSKIRIVNASGIINTFAGTGANGFSGDGGAATAALLNLATDVELDASGVLYIVDRFNNRIRQIDNIIHITGVFTLVTGGSTTLSASTPGGSWSSSNTAVATVGSATGIVSGISSGTVTITYLLPQGCYALAVVTVTGSKPATDMGDQSGLFSVYPNPTQGSLNIEASVNGTAALFTIDGKLMNEYKIEAPATSIALPRSMAAGIYMLRFKGDDGSSKVVRLVYEQ